MRLPGTYILPMIHPAKILRDATMAFACVEDWKKAVRIQREGCTLVPPPIEDWQWQPTIEAFSLYMDDVERDPGPWGIDFEATPAGQVVCGAIWYAPEPLTHKGLCTPWLCQGGAQYWSQAESAYATERWKKFLTNPKILKTGQNLVGYDTGFGKWNKRSLVKRAWNCDVQGVEIDTYPLHHILFSELLHGLAFQASIVTDLSPYKDEVHERDDDSEEDDTADDWARVLEKPDRKLRIYCLCDTFAQVMSRLSLIQEAWVIG